MKNFLEKVGVILSLLVLTVLLVTGKGTASVWGASSGGDDSGKKGSITLQLSADSTGVEITLWKVADYQDGKYIFSNGFEKSGITITNLKDAGEAQKAADSLAAYAAAQGIQAADIKTVDENGKILFSGLNPALYLAGETSGNEIMNVQGVLVPIPYLGENGAGVYDAEISPKYSFPGGVLLVHKVDEEGNSVGQAEFVLQQKVSVDSQEQVPDGAESGSDGNGTFYWKEFSANLVSDANGQIVITDMPKGSYRVIETKTPDGYIPSSVPYEFSIEAAGQVKELDGIYEAASGRVADVTVINTRISTSVNKVDEDGNYVSGAKFVVKDADGKVIMDGNGNAKYVFTSGAEPYILKGIPAGDYYLSELEPPKGFTVARDVKFSVSNEPDAVNTVTMVDEKEKTASGAITVTKNLYDEEYKDLMAEDGVFYVALFADQQLTTRVSAVSPITFKGVSSSSTTFADLDPGTQYYVAETDEYGTVIDADIYKNIYSYTPVYPDGQEVQITRKAPAKDYHFNNLFYELPEGYYYQGVIAVTKNVLKNGEAADSKDTFYVGIFTDPEHTNLFENNVYELAMDGNSSVTVEVPVMIGDSKDAVVKYYVTETDKNGVPLDESSDLTFTYTVKDGDVVLNYENNRAEVVITNEFEDVTPTVTPAEDITETPGGSDDSHTTSTYVKTGDDTPIGLYVTLLVLAACAVVAAVVLAKKKNKKD